MIRFAYPNVKTDQTLRDVFIGCGRFLTTTVKDPLLLRHAYVPANPKGVGSEVTSLAQTFAPESEHTGFEVYECKDDPAEAYYGPSAGLAYLLALVRRSRKTPWDDLGCMVDVWCSGVIEHPALLKKVSQNEFDVKFVAFVQQATDKLFILPQENWKPQHTRLCQEHAIREITFTSAMSLDDLIAHKTIVRVPHTLLSALLERLFFTPQPIPVRLQRLRDFTVQIRQPGADMIAGTGIVVAPDGQILTCASVIATAPGQHPRQGSAAEVDVYFPQLAGNQEKMRRAFVITGFDRFDDDVVLLQLKGDAPAPLDIDQMAVLGRAELSEGHHFESYGYVVNREGYAVRTAGVIAGVVQPPASFGALANEPVQLRSDQIAQQMNGAAVLDRERNLVVGFISTRYSEKLPGDDNRAYAVDAQVLTLLPFHRTLHDSPFPKRFAPRPNPQTPVTAARALACRWNNAPPALAAWVGRDMLVNTILEDWIAAECRLTGLIGFGGEGKSSLARKAAEALWQETLPGVLKPDGLFWWGFYTRPGLDDFFEAALTYLSGGQLSASQFPSTGERVKVLGNMLSAGRYLVILDGLEVMQYQDHDRYGLLKSSELRELLDYFADPEQTSFCLLTSRAPVTDLMEYTTYRQRSVTHLTPEDGTQLLKKLGVQGDTQDLQQISERWGGHALTLSLLGTYLAEYCAGDVSRLPEYPEQSDAASPYDLVNKILRRYDEHLHETEQTFLLLFSAFRIPVTSAAFQTVFRMPHTALASVSDGIFESMVTRLRTYGLVQYDPSQHQYAAHPLVISYYRQQSNAANPDFMRAVHQRIATHYLDSARELSDNPRLEDFGPLIEAVYHVCRAGAYDEAFRILADRINQQQYQHYFLTDRFGAWGMYLALLSEFYPEQDVTRNPPLSDSKEQGMILHETGYALMMLGRLAEALPFYQRSLDVKKQLAIWWRTSIAYQNLVEISMHLGRLPDGLQEAQLAVHAARQEESERRPHEECLALTDQAWLSHLLGDLDSASKLFHDAEQLERKIQGHDYALLTGLPGIRYADHLRRIGNAAYAEFVTIWNHHVCQQKDWPDYMSGCHRLLGELNAQAGQHEHARRHFDAALKIARSISRRDILIEILLTRGRWAARDIQHPQSATEDLAEALEYSKYNGYRLYEVDAYVALAWAQLAAKNITSARERANYALRLGQTMSYYWGKRDADEILREIEKETVSESQ